MDGSWSLPSGYKAHGERHGEVDVGRDRELVTRAQSGDSSAFAELYATYFRRLRRLCTNRLRDATEAEDVAQEAFARAWRALPNFNGERRFYPWLTVIANNLCTDVMRKRELELKARIAPRVDGPSGEGVGEEQVIATSERELVGEAMLRLSPQHQRLLRLREELGWSYDRIARHEGVSMRSVETLVWRARKALKHQFAKMSDGEGYAVALLASLLSLKSVRRAWSRMAKPSARLQSALPVHTMAPFVATALGGVVAVVVQIVPGQPACAAATAAPPTSAIVAAMPESFAASIHSLGEFSSDAADSGEYLPATAEIGIGDQAQSTSPQPPPSVATPTSRSFDSGVVSDAGPARPDAGIVPPVLDVVSQVATGVEATLEVADGVAVQIAQIGSTLAAVASQVTTSLTQTAEQVSGVITPVGAIVTPSVDQVATSLTQTAEQVSGVITPVGAIVSKVTAIVPGALSQT